MNFEDLDFNEGDEDNLNIIDMVFHVRYIGGVIF